MNESALPKGSGLSVSVDLTDDDPPMTYLSYRVSLTVNEWLADIDAEETQAAGFNLGAYVDSPAVVKAPLSSIFGSALLPLLDDNTVDQF